MFKTVAVILVNDLLLEGIQEHIFKIILTDLTDLNYSVKKVAILHENENILTNELNILSKQFDVVIVVGKLVNDLVFKALTNITSKNCVRNIQFKAILDDLQKFNFCQLPVASKLLTGNDLVYPIIQVQTVFILNEQYLEKQLNILRKRLAQYRLQTKFKKTICIQKNGNTKQLLDYLGKINIATVCEKSGSELAVTLESCSFSNIVEIEKTLKQELMINFVSSYIMDNITENVYSDSDEGIQKAIENIEKCLKDYGPSNVFLSFNGGKDCTVLLHLIRTVINAKYPNYKNPILCLYVRSENAFPEQDDFISQCEIYFNLEVITVTNGIKEALTSILLMKPNLQACFMGTRRTDPYSSDLKIFQMTDMDWPQIMRVSPLLDWHYSDIWDYLLYFKVPYCTLYDMGYTSLGNASNTVKNPSLLYNDIYLGKEVYLPAYKMFNENKERSGRNICK